MVFLLYGFVLWAAGTAALRVAGHDILKPDNPASIAILFAVSFPLMALVARRLCARKRLAPQEWPRAAILLCAPSLLLDPFSSAFFARAFPNLPAQAAGLFGGWILWCCGGALLGALWRG
jgi:hypothetical protein